MKLYMGGDRNYDLKVVTWSLNDEVKQELKQIIIECSRNTNMPSLLGHTEKDLEK